MKISYDVVKRWINEAQEAASSDNIMVQVRLLQEALNMLQGFKGSLGVLKMTLEKTTGFPFSPIILKTRIEGNGLTLRKYSKRLRK